MNGEAKPERGSCKRHAPGAAHRAYGNRSYDKSRHRRIDAWPARPLSQERPTNQASLLTLREQLLDGGLNALPVPPRLPAFRFNDRIDLGGL